MSDSSNFTIMRESIPARFTGDISSHTVMLKIAVRAKMGQDLPTKSELEIKVARDLLRMKLDEGAAWEVASIMIPDAAAIQSLMELVQQLKYRLDEVFTVAEKAHEQLVTNAQDTLFVLSESLKDVLSLP